MARQTFENVRVISSQRTRFHFSLPVIKTHQKSFKSALCRELLTSSHDPTMKTTCNTLEAIGGKLMFICHWLAILSIDSTSIHSSNQRSRCVICGRNLEPLNEGVVNDRLMVFTRMIDLRSDSIKMNPNTTA